MDELIRKRDALDAAIKADMENHNGILSEKRAKVFEEHISILPPVQTEPLTDYEQRIFLAAMGKESAVCKKLTDEWDGMKLDVPCPVNLLRLCAEVERKVKASLWKN